MNELLAANHIHKRYASHTALDDVSVVIPEKSIFGLLGPNGAGKTSLIRIINQITGPDQGEVLFDGKPLRPEHVAQIGYLPEERGLYKKMEVGEQALYLAQLKGMKRKEARTKLNEWFRRFEVDGWWNKKVEELSKGMQQKIQFIVTVLHEPRLLILDEPFSGFDPINANLIRNEILRLREKGATILFSTHNMGSVEELCDHIALINRSRKVLDGPVKEIRRQYRTSEYEIEFKGTMMAFTNSLWTFGKLGEHFSEGDYCRARVRLAEGASANQLLQSVLPVVDIISFREIIPSMNDIFISVVGEEVTLGSQSNFTE